LDVSTRNRTDPLFAIQDAHDQVLMLLDDPRVSPLESVRWLSAHAASFRRSVHPEILRVLEDAAAVDLLHRGALCIERVLVLLERKHTGDPTAERFDEAALSQSLVALLVIQAGKVDWVLARLARRLSGEEQRDVVAAYRRGLELAPRPLHPFAPVGRAGRPPVRARGHSVTLGS
jgi:hypothetical protein